MNNAEYLERLRKVIERDASAAHLPALAPVLAMFLEEFRPGDPTAENGDNMTSLDIVYSLEDTCNLTVNDVTQVMLFMGYRLHVGEYRGHEWAMVHASIADSSTPPICK